MRQLLIWPFSILQSYLLSGVTKLFLNHNWTKPTQLKSARCELEKGATDLMDSRAATTSCIPAFHFPISDVEFSDSVMLHSKENSDSIGNFWIAYICCRCSRTSATAAFNSKIDSCVRFAVNNGILTRNRWGQWRYLNVVTNGREQAAEINILAPARPQWIVNDSHLTAAAQGSSNYNRAEFAKFVRLLQTLLKMESV